MEELRLKDCLDPEAVRVNAFDRYEAVARDAGRVFVVTGEDGAYLGMVTEREAALFPNRIFADLLLRRPEPLLSDQWTPLEVLEEMGRRQRDVLPVGTDSGDFVGVVSRLSIAEALADRERRQREALEALLDDYRHELEQKRIAAAVFDATSEGIMVTDAEQHIIQVNPAFEYATGWSRDEAVGKTPAILHSGVQDAGFYAAMWRTLEQTDAWEGEIWNRRKDGELYPEWLHINAIRGEDGAIHYFVGVFSDTTRHLELRERLRYLGDHDALTGLPNRQLFRDRLERGMREARRAGTGLAVAFVDLDGFKEVNDTRGHAIGDELLMGVADALRDAVREGDSVARFGGDEFNLLLPAEDPHAVTAVVERVLAALNRAFRVGDNGDEIRISASVGISLFPQDGDTAEGLLIAADNALYEAKVQDRSGYRFFSAPSYDRYKKRVQLTSDLRRAISAGEITLNWQPQVDLASGRVVGLEALARWCHPDGTFVRPDVFVPLAEQSGLIEELGLSVFRRAMQEAASLRRSSSSNACSEVRFAVNVSPLQVRPATNGDADLAEILIGLAESWEVAADRLELELTETALSQSPEYLHGLLQRLGATGVRVAVDDFGTGCSNLETIKRLPVQKLKLDRSMVQDLVTDGVDREIVTAIVGMARALKLSVLAEGVETEAQANILRELGCDHAQGYLFGRPQPMDTLRTTL